MLRKVIINVFVLLYVVIVKSQVCTRTKLVTTSALITYFESSPDGDGFYTTQFKHVTKSSITTTKVCCEGYIQGYDEYEELYEYYDTSRDSSITCNPVCDPACINGECTSPGVCTCPPGYISKANESHVCIPVCTGCEFGTCIAANTCVCFFGYQRVNGSSCHPICTEPCPNGVCEAPEQCSCHPGYKKSDNSSCEPDCSGECDDGFCIKPESCVDSSTTMSPVNISDHENWEEKVVESSWADQHPIMIFSSSVVVVLVVAGIIYMLTRVWRQRSQTYAVAQQLPLNNSRRGQELHRDEIRTEQMVDNENEDQSPTV